ncbi:EAL domain-containing protein [Histidinibacterium lentulum]|uniref:EAL domain-containing protein n=1 Tax=Histidinibacterium lentulum TaxID=2480588 RepID=A0A3N2QVU6_9RHOB|nr:EAL domain-containing protein [Histidinibacterium lentulum]ROT99353.1 EAL domain-containing protein [Histidinibacterium lentulum]
MTAFDQTRAAHDAQDPFAYVLAARDHDTPEMVREALAAGRCSLAVQPVMLAGGGIGFYEGLIRITDSGGRLLPARVFHPLVEETALGRDIDAAALSLGFDLLRRNPGVRLSINVSARSLADSAWRKALSDSLAASPLAPERLILEITERSAMLLPEVVARFMAEMQPVGIAFALDDFGGGFTSFRHLRSFFFDLVKFDQSFTEAVADSPDNQALISALLAVAHQFDMFAVAPGVERAADADWLTGAGVDCLQGYHLGAPRTRL